jgi:hypothetical protein
MSGNDFVAAEQKAQASYFARAISPELVNDVEPYRLRPGQHLMNLAPAIRVHAEDYFGAPRDIVWHQHANHGLSSQACCLNFLMPLATQPVLLARLIEKALGIDGVDVLPIEKGPNGESIHVAFEWIGLEDHLGEWRAGKNTKQGANATSADAAVRFERQSKIEIVLIEWKYTEKYGAPLKADGHPTRIARYADKAFAPNGPLRGDLDLKLEEFFWDPQYQLLRQQILAWRMEQAHELDAERVSVLHISPTNNRALHKVTAPALRRFGDDVFSVFRSLLAKPERFVSVTTEQMFAPFLAMHHADPLASGWAAYIRDRYSFLSAIRDQNG